MNESERAAWTTGPGPEAIFAQHLAAGEFRIQRRCAGCERHVFYPRLACSHCGSVELQWHAPSGRGTVYTPSASSIEVPTRAARTTSCWSISPRARA